ncbi:uncharacterized protein LOC130629708 [Hydractinia symbiolongicarpus]|uniref:uncharacterized protein LOC130629708 n=1 Tax=Hydractinia symbiolongicarpus TaxID=13093 RepID=UPI00254CF37A|nr:uncharacterized protein LOC130629708 [Hydractinia symbiolongicarpus]
MWISACKRKNKDGTADWNPTGKNVYLCGKHFTTGKPVKDPAHPDYIPTIFVYTQNDSEKKNRKIRVSQKKKPSKSKNTRRTKKTAYLKFCFTRKATITAK